MYECETCESCGNQSFYYIDEDDLGRTIFKCKTCGDILLVDYRVFPEGEDNAERANPCAKNKC